MAFKVGDLVTGLPEAPYGFTTSDAVMKIIGIEGSHLNVRVLKHKGSQRYIGRTTYVRSKYFKLVNVELTNK